MATECSVCREKIWFKIASNADRGSNTYMKASVRKNADTFVNFYEIKMSQKVGLFDLDIQVA